jgi:D-sedoheptulose 7-phosphate isomerase
VSALDKQPHPMALESRATEFAAVLAAGVVTDRIARRTIESGLREATELLTRLRDRKNRVYVVGNGGSAGIASHAVTDFLNVGRLRAATLHDPSLLTCMANDYGYETAFANMLKVLAGRDDVLIAISSSGKSMNIRNAVDAMRSLGGTCITLSGFDSGNPLRAMGELNFWLDSNDYGMVEIGHQFILHNIADRLRLGL